MQPTFAGKVAGAHEVHAERHREAHEAAGRAAEKADGACLGQEQRPDVAYVASQRLHHAYLARALGDAHHHGVRDSQRGHEERDGAQAAQHELLLRRLLLHGLADGLHRVGREAHALDLLLHVGHVRDVVDLDDGLAVGEGRRLAGDLRENRLHIGHVHDDALARLIALRVVFGQLSHGMQGKAHLLVAV